nr:transposase [Cloacibacterium caeni]
MGYLNNINSDRQLIAFCSDSLSIRLFLGYDVHEQLPWHSTISRTRGLYGEECHVLKKVYTFYINTKIRLQFKYNSKIYLQPPFFCNNFSIYNLPF